MLGRQKIMYLLRFVGRQRGINFKMRTGIPELGSGEVSGENDGEKDRMDAQWSES